MSYFIGFDVGSSKTHALLSDGNGCCLGLGKAQGGNQQGVGYDGLLEALRKSLEAALLTAELSLDQLSGAGFGIAGYDFPSDRQPHLEAITRLHLGCPVEIINDGEN